MLRRGQAGGPSGDGDAEDAGCFGRKFPFHQVRASRQQAAIHRKQWRICGVGMVGGAYRMSNLMGAAAITRGGRRLAHCGTARSSLIRREKRLDVRFPGEPPVAASWGGSDEAASRWNGAGGDAGPGGGRQPYHAVGCSYRLLAARNDLRRLRFGSGLRHLTSDRLRPIN